MYNSGQTAVFIKDLSGREYPAIAEVNRKKRVNGQRELSLSFLYTEINKDFMGQLEFGWKILFDGEWYTITHPGYSTDGDFFAINVTAILSFFVDLNGYYLQDKAEDKSTTPAAYFSSLFQGTPYSYVLVGNFNANTLSYEDNQSKTERFLYGIDRFDAEYKVQGKLAYLHNQIGNDKDVILHEDLNVNSVRIDVDASGFHTWAKGYGDLPEDDLDGDYQLEVEYVSPLASKYGMIEGPAIKDGNYKHADALTKAVKHQVENSYIISTQIDAVDLTNNGYPEMILEEGDRIWLFVSKLNLNQQVRVMEIDEYFDWEGNIIDARYTVGNEGIASRYKTQQYDTLKNFRDILSGRKKLGYDWLPEAIKRAAEIINGNQDSLFQYRAGEIIGINQNNPNGYMRFNTDGIGFSRDGGKTYKSAVTYEGIIAESIIGGSIIGVNLMSADESGIFHVSGADAEFINASNSRRVKINPDGLFGYNADETIRFMANQTLVTSSAFGTSVQNVYLASYGEARVVNYDDIPGDGEVGSYRYLPLRAANLFADSVDVNQGTNLYLRTYSNGEVRVTNVGSVTAFRALRASNFFGDSLDTNAGSALYLRAPSTGEVRATVNGSTTAYIPMRASNYFGDSLDANVGPNVYVRPYSNGEVRITNTGSTTAYRPLRAANLFADSLDANVGPNVYIRPTSDGVVRITAKNTTDVFRPIEASEFNVSSSQYLKKNIEDYTEKVLPKINSTSVRAYHLNEDVEGVDPKRIGLIVQESPVEVVNINGGESNNIYAMASLLWKGVQELSAENEDLKRRIEILEMAV